MKTLVVFLLICAVMALTNAAAVPEAEPDVKMGKPSVQEDENHIVQGSKSCPQGWIGYSGRCFLFIPTPMTWANAEKTCLCRGGNLASVHSLSEQNFIQSLILSITRKHPLTWLGGSDSEQEGTWFWSDGSPFDFTHWDVGQPDNFRQAHCLVMNFGDHKKYDDQPCYITTPFICAMKL